MHFKTQQQESDNTYAKARNEEFDKLIADNSDLEPLRDKAMEIAQKEGYSGLSSQDIFTLAGNEDVAPVDNAPVGGQVSTGTDGMPTFQPKTQAELRALTDKELAEYEQDLQKATARARREEMLSNEYGI